jgi:hypothetical protein
MDKLMDLPLSLKKIAGRRWLCYCLAAAVAKEAATKEWQHVLTLLHDFQI